MATAESIKGTRRWDFNSFHVWLQEQLDVVEREEKHPCQDLDTLETCGQIVQEAGDIAARLGFADLYTKSREVAPDHDTPELGISGPLSGPPAAYAFLAECVAACYRRMTEAMPRSTTESAAGNTVIDLPRLNQLPKMLPARCERAYRLYKIAENTLGAGKPVKDRRAHAWLRGQYGEQIEEFETWRRYVRHARRYFGDQKNSSRHGRPHGSSIVNADQIDSPFVRDKFDSFD